MKLYRTHEIHEDEGRCGEVACAKVYVAEDVDQLIALLREARGAIFRYSPSGVHRPDGQRLVSLNSADGRLIGRIDAVLSRR